MNDLWHWRNDFGLAKLLSKEELTSLVRQVNVADEEKEFNTGVRYLDFEGFKKFVIQVAILAFSRGK